MKISLHNSLVPPAILLVICCSAAVPLTFCCDTGAQVPCFTTFGQVRYKNGRLERAGGNIFCKRRPNMLFFPTLCFHLKGTIVTSTDRKSNSMKNNLSPIAEGQDVVWRSTKNGSPHVCLGQANLFIKRGAGNLLQEASQNRQSESTR